MSRHNGRSSVNALHLAKELFNNKDWDWLSKRLLLYTDRSLREKNASPEAANNGRLGLTSRVIREFHSGKIVLSVPDDSRKKDLREAILVGLAFEVENKLQRNSPLSIG